MGLVGRKVDMRDAESMMRLGPSFYRGEVHKSNNEVSTSKSSVEVRKIVTSEWNWESGWRERVGVRRVTTLMRNHETRRPC